MVPPALMVSMPTSSHRREARRTAPPVPTPQSEPSANRLSYSTRTSLFSISYRCSHPIVHAAQHRLYVLHDLAQLERDPVADGFSAVIAGHSHVPRIDQRDGVMFLNPGSAGPRRFRLPITLALLTLVDGQLRAQLVDLSQRQENARE